MACCLPKSPHPTGGSSGVGRQVVQWLAQHGATVITGSRAPGSAAEGLAADLSRRKVPGETAAKPGECVGDPWVTHGCCVLT